MQKRQPCFVKFNNGSLVLGRRHGEVYGSAVISKILIHDFDNDGVKDAVVIIDYNPPQYTEFVAYYVPGNNTQKTQMVRVFGMVKDAEIKNNKLAIKAEEEPMIFDQKEKVFTYSVHNGQMVAD